MFSCLARPLIALALLIHASSTAAGQKPTLVVQAGHSNIIGYLAFSPDGQLLASSAEDRSIKIWDVKTGRELRTLVSDAPVTYLRFKEDSRFFYSSTVKLPREPLSGWSTYDDSGAPLRGKVRLWDASNGEAVPTDVGELEVDKIPTQSLSHDGKLGAEGFWGGKIVVTNVSAGKELWSSDCGEGVSAVAFSSDDRLLAVGCSDTKIRLYNALSGEKIRTLEGYSDSTTAIALGRDFKIIATGSGVAEGAEESDTIWLWDGTSGELSCALRESFSDVRALALSRDNRFLAGGSRRSLKIWSICGGTESRTLASEFDPGEPLVFHPSGRVLLHGGADSPRWGVPQGWIKFWDVSTGTLRRLLSFPNTDILAISPNGRLAVGGTDWGDDNREGAANFIKLIEVESGRTLHRIPIAEAKDVRAAAFSFDGGVTAGWLWGGSSVAVWDSTTGERLRTLRGIPPIAVSPDGKILAACGPARSVINLYDVATGELIATLRGHANVVRTLKFSDDGKILISGGLDTNAKLWEVTTGRELASLITIGLGGWLVVTPDGLFDGSTDAMRQVSWRIGEANEIVSLDAFFNDFYHPGLLAEIIEGGRPKANIGIATLLQLPGLRTMLSQGLARVERRDGKSFLCFNERPTAQPQLYSDGLPYAFDPNELTYHRTDTSCHWRSKELPGDHQIEIAGVTGGQKSEVFKLPYDGVKSETSRSTLHVLTVGVGSYDLAKSGLKPLPSSVSGAREVEALFATQVNGQSPPYSRVRVWGGLYDHAATREAIRRRFAEMAREVKEDDVLFMFFSGHGVIPAGQEMFYLAPVDMRGPNPQEQRETGLNVAMLAEAVRGMRARRVVVIIDACQSGGALESLAKIGEVKAKVESRKARLGKGSARREATVGVYVLTAATPLQEAIQPERGNGALVTALLEGLRPAGGAAGGEVWVSDVMNYVQRRLPELSEEMGRRHTPMIVRTGVDFPLLKARPAKNGNN
jgi:WD40 repeat protein